MELAQLCVSFCSITEAFDPIEHSILVQKIDGLATPLWGTLWISDFPTNRQQRVKLPSTCSSNWKSVTAGVFQRTKLGTWLFFLMKNDLQVPSVATWNYVDDTTVAKVFSKGKQRHD